MSVKYCKLSTFPEHRFKFPELLKYQGIDSLASDCGAYYPNLVKEFYANMNFGTDDFGDPTFTYKVKNMEISMDLEYFGKTLGIPTAGVSLRQGYQPASDSSETYNKMEYFFEICWGSQADILSRYNPASSRFILFVKNLSVSDCMLHYVVAYLLLPNHSNHSQIIDLELQTIFAIKNMLKVNWSFTILHHMRH